MKLYQKLKGNADRLERFKAARPPLPVGWRIDGDRLETEDGATRNVRTQDGKLDALKISMVCESYGLFEYSALWRGGDSARLVWALSQIDRLCGLENYDAASVSLCLGEIRRVCRGVLADAGQGVQS